MNPETLVATARELAGEGWRLSALTCAGGDNELLYHFARGPELRNFRLTVPEGVAVPSLCDVYPGSYLAENELQDLFGLAFAGLVPDLKGRLYLNADEAPEPLEGCAPHAVGDLQPGRTIIPFGPQHPVLPEPLQLKLVMEEERVVGVQPVLGYVHRGLERLAESRDYQQMVYVVERVCGICSFMHALAYSMGLEELMGLEVPDRARYLRVVWAELHRLHSHLLWAGLLADALGFESLFMQLWRAREIILDLLEKTAGNRIIISTAMVGGVRRDIPPALAAEVQAGLDRLERELERIAPALTQEGTVLRRTRGKGVLSPELVQRFGVVGPAARASGVREDVRTEGYAAYGDLGFAPVVEEGGDVLARTVVRLKECFQSIGLVRQALARLPEGPLAVKAAGPVPEGEVTVRVEQPRGEVLYYIRANGTPKLSRLRVRTPTFANLPALFAMLPGHDLADVPVLLASIDPCISCTER